MIWILLVFGVISSSVSIPTKSPLYELIVSDSRTEGLRKYPFVKECKNENDFSKSICYSLYDASLSFNAQKLEFTKVSSTVEDEKFCDALFEALPDSPANNDAITSFNTSARWLKDILKQDEGKSACMEKCFFEDYQTYEKKHSAACQFILDQFSFLKTRKSAVKVPEVQKVAEIKPASKIEPKDSLGFLDPPQATSAEKSVELPEKLPTVVAKGNEPLLKTEEAPVKNTVDVEQPENQPIPGSVTKPLNLSAAPSKPIVQTAPPATQIKTTEQTKTDASKVDEAEKQDPSNGDDLDNNTDVFGDGETPEKETDQKNSELYDDDDESLTEDLMTRDNNNRPDVKIPQGVEATAESIPKTKVEFVDFEEDPDSNFFTYLCILMFLCILFYILHQNRHKLLALCLEGRRGNRRNRERGRGGSKAAYSKLDCNLEEAIMSNKSLSGKSMDVIY